jgi:hypothetical protein
MTATTTDQLRANLVGAWSLQSYESASIDSPAYKTHSCNSAPDPHCAVKPLDGFGTAAETVQEVP